MRYRWLLFDADNTLFDYDKAETTALALTFREFGLPLGPNDTATYRAINAEIWLAFERGEIDQESLRTARFQRLFEAIGQEQDPNPFSGRYLHNLASASDLMEGAEVLIKSLREKVSLALITNGIAVVQRSRLARSPIADCFETIVISEEVGASKPSPEIFDVAFERMGGPDKPDVLIIGDSLTSDMRGGLDYGIDTCWYNPRGKPGDPNVPVRYEIRTLDQLRPTLGLG